MGAKVVDNGRVRRRKPKAEVVDACVRGCPRAGDPVKDLSGIIALPCSVDEFVAALRGRA
jgi:hypothetical protein